MKTLIVYTDGAISHKVGGWAAIIIENNEIVKSIAGREMVDAVNPALRATNNRMELQAVLEALIEIEDSFDLKSIDEIHVTSDSQYVVYGGNTWISRWKKNNWKGSAGKIKNRDQWEKIDQFMEKNKVIFHWVRGHNGDKYNEMVDKLAVAQYADVEKLTDE